MDGAFSHPFVCNFWHKTAWLIGVYVNAHNIPEYWTLALTVWPGFIVQSIVGWFSIGRIPFCLHYVRLFPAGLS